MQITVPPLQNTATGWRKTITAVGTAKGGAAIEGAWLEPGDTVDLTAGTLVLAIDKITTGWDHAYRTGERIPVQNATVAIHLVSAQDGLRPVWNQYYKSSKSAFGATTMKKIAALIQQHPAPLGAVTVVVESRRPNRHEGRCRWCRATLYKGLGHLAGHGDSIQMEHYQKCPPRYAASGTPCTLCGVTITAGSDAAPADRVMVREGDGRWETRHADRVGCVSTPPESHEERTARLAAAREAANAAHAEALRKQREADEKKAQRAQARRAAAQAAEAAEAARVAELGEVGRLAKNLNDKGLGDGLRAALDEITVSLSDGTGTTRWAVRVYAPGSGWTGEDGDPGDDEQTEYTRKADAQAAYRAMKFQPDPRRTGGYGRTCDECGSGGARFYRRDSSGIAGVVCARCDSEEDYQLSFA